MEPQPHDPKRKPLVTVEFQTEVDLPTGKAERRMFLKMYFEALDSGLLAAIPDREWKTLCALACFMDENGYCYPSQARLAAKLRLTRQTMNERIGALRDFRFRGQPVISVERRRVHTANGPTRWGHNVYRIHPIASLGIFNSQASATASKPAKSAQISMSAFPDIETSMSGLPDTGNADTNQRDRFNHIVNVKDLEKSLKRSQPTGNADFQKRLLVAEIEQVCGDPHSRGFYRKIADKVPEDLIRTALSETKYRTATGQIKKSAGAFFTAEISRIAMQHGIDLKVNPSKPLTRDANR